jgi:hypothetical protein
VSDLRGYGFECEELWHVDRMLATDDWAIYDFGGEGIEARHVQKHVVEEQLQLMLHAERMTRWVLRQSRMLIDLPSDPHLKPRKIFRNNLKLQLLQRDKVAQSLLGMKNADLLPAERRNELLELRDLISKVMHCVLKVPDLHDPDDDDDGDDPGED